jgi:AcrR family transcriptional regulator
MPRKTDYPRLIIDNALELAATKGWAHTSLNDIAAAAGLSLAALHGTYPSKTAIVAAYTTRVDEAVLNDIDPELADKSSRERLFDVLMKRFDAMNPHKEAVRSILRASTSDVEALARGPLSLYRSMRWMMEAANIPSSGMRGQLRIKGLALIYLAVLRTWFNDDSEDMSRTMASLDRQLSRADRLLGFLRRRGHREPGMPDGENAAGEPSGPVEAGAG